MQLPRKSFLSFSSLSKLTTFPALSVSEFQIWYFTNCWIVWNMLQLKQNSSSPSDVFHQSVNSFFSHYIPCAFYSFGIKLSSGNTQTEKHERGRRTQGLVGSRGRTEIEMPLLSMISPLPLVCPKPGARIHVPPAVWPGSNRSSMLAAPFLSHTTTKSRRMAWMQACLTSKFIFLVWFIFLNR